MILEIDTESLLVTVYQGLGFRVYTPLEYNYVDTMEHSRSCVSTSIPRLQRITSVNVVST